ncbi:MAG: hypothetical protein U0694_19160 [Anaerolineae bacterium]
MLAMPTLEQLAALPPYFRKTIPEDYRDAMGQHEHCWYMALYDSGGTLRDVRFDHAYYQSRQSGAFALR